MTRGAKRRLLFSFLFVGAVASPFCGSYLLNEVAISEHLGGFPPGLPEGTELLKGRTRVVKTAAGCAGIVSATIASELGPDRVVDFYRERESATGNAVSAAWQRGAELWFQRPQDPEPVRASENDPRVPHLPQSMLTKYAMLPKGVKRLALFKSVAIAPKLDPRCL